ncbi:MAG: thiamine biosynthesis protein ThiI [Candidatus Methanolliviera sp. GoM_asphalt]|nr:MAG: thiamine biosynthesis protein ThiI [Candidatus Methanolliviera sp. GoM_asphalt]
MIRYGELALKSEYVRRQWEGSLIESIRRRIKGCNIWRERGRIWVDTEENTSSELKNIPGIHSFSLCERCELDELGESLLKFTGRSLMGERTFALRINRVGEHDFTSQDAARYLGAEIIKRFPDLSVDLSKPEKEIFIEIREKECYIFDEITKGMGGIPEGVEGKLICLLSGKTRKITSAIACWMMMRRGCEIIPFCYDEDSEMAIGAVEILKEFQPDIRLRVLDRDDRKGRVEDAIREYRALGIVCGSNLRIFSSEISVPIYQPLIGFDRLEIEKIAERMEISKIGEKIELFNTRIKLVSLISGGIDSPVATYLMMNRGADVIALHLDNRPFTDKRELEKSLKIVRYLENSCDRDIKTYIVLNGENLAAFKNNCRRKLQCLFCRRTMLRIAEKIAWKEGADGILTGESLGQVATQTLQNIYVTDRAIEMPVIRPLIGMDKIEIIDIARKIGTYDLSILPSSGCKIVPKKPATAAKLEEVLREEERIDLDSLIEGSVRNAYIL